MSNGIYLGAKLRRRSPGDKTPNCACEACGKPLYRMPSQIKGRVYCTTECRSESRRVQRECKQCKAMFYTQIGRLSGKTNSSANYCSRPCYEAWLCSTPRTRTRGPRWHVISKEVTAAFPFCACCGARRKRLEVHHIVPYRLTGDNDRRNLIPLCSRCHKRVELATIGFMNEAGATAESVTAVVGAWLRRRQLQTLQMLKKIANERPQAPVPRCV